jgi:hypothetical protein
MILPSLISESFSSDFSTEPMYMVALSRTCSKSVSATISLFDAIEIQNL